MEIDQETYQRIAQEINSDASPVGIDAKKTHILIIHMLQDIQKRLAIVEEQVKSLRESK